MSDYIPPELIPNILARLSVRDVLRCTSVSKSWYSLITSLSFACLHLNLSSPNQEPRVLVQKQVEGNGISYYSHRDNQTFDEIAQVDFPDHIHWRMLDGLNGLFCWYDEYKGITTLWNPSVRKSFVLPKPSFSYKNKKDIFGGYYPHKLCVGFGFLQATNECMVVMFSFHYEPEAQIFELSTGAWRHISLGGNFNANSLVISFSQAQLKDILHWSAYDVTEEMINPRWICSFDMKNEKFGTLMVPSCLRHDYLGVLVNLTYRDSLCLAEFSIGRCFCNMWVMKEYGVNDSWEKLFGINYEAYMKPLYFRHDGEILCERWFADLVFYDYKNNQVRNVVITSPAKTVTYGVYTFVESLFLVKVPNAVETVEESKKISKGMLG